MATWQHDLFLIPITKLREFYGSIPATVSEADFYEKSWWEGVPPFDEREIEAILPQFVNREGEALKGWFGSDLGDRFSITYSDDEQSIAEVLLRIDLTGDALKIRSFVQQVADLAKRNGWTFLATSGHVVPAEADAILKELELNPTDVHRVL